MKRSRRLLGLVSIAGVGLLVAGADYLTRRADTPPAGARTGDGGGAVEPVDAATTGSASENGAASTGEPAARAGVGAALAALARRADAIGPAELDRLFGLAPPAAHGAGDPPRDVDGSGGDAAALPRIDRVPSASGLRLTAVSTSGGGSAIINGSIYRVGEPRNGVELLRVTGRSATVEVGGRSVELVLD